MSFPIPILSDLVSKGIDSIVRWKESADKKEITKAEFEAQKEQWKLEMNKYLLDQAGRPDREFREFVLAYEGSGDNVHPLVQFMRGAIRPFITVWAVVIITLLMFSAGAADRVGVNLDKIPDQLWTIFEYVFGFWFGGRAVQHAITEYSNGKVSERKQQASAEMEVARQQTRQMAIQAGVELELAENTEQDFTAAELDRALPSRVRKYIKR
ncbi:hypothetical protein [Oceanobacter antarcticus]|uniref:Holin of 3TMs, for gene-transfer release n=1 Tax=Oceanobacter antarcticus TaxID=3133425 RepID=A0ABW8NN01_9GAMM